MHAVDNTRVTTIFTDEVAVGDTPGPNYVVRRGGEDMGRCGAYVSDLSIVTGNSLKQLISLEEMDWASDLRHLVNPNL